MRALFWSIKALLPLGVAALASSALPGCTTEAACFDDCHGSSDIGTGGTKGDSGGKGGSFVIDMGGKNGGPNGGGTKNGGGVGGLEPTPMACDGVDLQTDVNNCGECGNFCIFTGADASCVDGKCEMGTCLDDRYDVNQDPGDGCEYACALADDPTEVCNYLDDDCDGDKDEGFDLSTDRENCGVCGHKCELLHAVSADCEPGNGTPSCVVVDCEPDWYDIDGVDANGCEYSCLKKGAGGVVCDGSDPNCGVELCDEYDNDCNGIINDGNQNNGGPEGGTPCTDFCTNGVCEGECTAGVNTCVGTDLVCVPGKGPTLEACDGDDNDCDGDIDEDFDFSKDPNNCGGCGMSCVNALPNAVAQCTDPAGAPPPACSILVCKPGFKDLDTNKPGCEACPKFPTSAETCNGIDDDCDGVIDNAAAIVAQKPAVNAFCNNGRDVATTPCSGTTVTCGGTSGWVCNYPAATGVEVDSATGKVRVVEQLCDNVDGNCDKQKDEAFLNKSVACTVGTGICARSASYTCTADKAGTECSAAAVATDSKDELCNGLDDNCDGQVDERTPVAGSMCYNGGNTPVACKGYVEPTVKVGATWFYTYEASRPDSSGTDPGVDTARACSKANVLPWTSVSQTEAAAACGAVPTSVANTKMRLCDETEWQTACLAGQNGSVPTWAFSSNPTVYDDLVCNDAAAGIDAPWVTSFNNGQSSRCRTSTQIWDMTGNVAEWTSSCYTILTKQYCRVRGGSFLSLGPATACNFTFVLDVPSFANFDLGFRCCSSVAP